MAVFSDSFMIKIDKGRYDCSASLNKKANAVTVKCSTGAEPMVYGCNVSKKLKTDIGTFRFSGQRCVLDEFSIERKLTPEDQERGFGMETDAKGKNRFFIEDVEKYANVIKQTLSTKISAL